MARWLISVPVWGTRHVEVFCATALPALARAVEVLRESCQDEVRVVVHTDEPERVLGVSDQNIVETRAVPAGLREFDCMSQAHREVLAMACRGDVVVPLTAGAVISAKGLRHCHRTLQNPRFRAVLCAVPRALEEGLVPTTEDAPALMRWAWENRHPMVDDCTWPEGRSADLSRTYYRIGNDDQMGVVIVGAVAARVCLPHPLAVRIDGRALRFVPTIDANLIQCFDTSEMHVVTDCEQLAVVKLTPADKGHGLSQETMEERLVAGALRIPDPKQRWCLGHRVTLVGPWGQDCGDGEVVRQILDGVAP